MADPVAALEIAEERKDDVRKLLQDAKKAASDKARDQIEQAKLDFRAGVAGSRRPEQFDPATMHITTYFDNFEPFRAIMNLDGAKAVNTFLTYVNQKALDTSGVTIGPADPALQGGAVSGGRKIARKCGTFFGKLNCSTSKSTRLRLEMYIF